MASSIIKCLSCYVTASDVSLFTEVSFCRDLAHLTLDVTAPHELAQAPLNSLDCARVVAPSAAQTLARLSALSPKLTLPSLRARHAATLASLTVVRRAFRVHEVVTADGLASRAFPASLELSFSSL